MSDEQPRNAVMLPIMFCSPGVSFDGSLLNNLCIDRLCESNEDAYHWLAENTKGSWDFLVVEEDDSLVSLSITFDEEADRVWFNVAFGDWLSEADNSPW